MKHITFKILMITLIIAVLGMTSASAAGMIAQEDPPAESHIVLFTKSIPSNFQVKVKSLGGNVAFTHKAGIAVVQGLSDAGAGKLSKLRGVQSVQPSGYFRLDPNAVLGEPINVDADPATAADPTSAYFYPMQWNMRAIHADEAWAIGRLGSPEVTVAILDTGIDYLYPDLAGRVDLSRSISFVPGDDALVDIYFPGRHYVTDLMYHGTHVAATVASNGLVAAGVTSGTTLMGVKVCDVYGECAGDAVVAGILYAVDNGADVINMSLGGYFYKNEYPGEVGFINKLFNYANRKGVTVVVSAGNGSVDLDHNKSEYATYCDAPNTICVSATGPTSADDMNFGPWYEVDAPAYYTNFGSSAIDVAAPGGNSGGYVHAACSQTSLILPICQTGTYVIGMMGTSMSAPHVSGTVSLVVEDVGRNPGRVKTILQKSADDLGDPGVDTFYGKGRINVFEAVN